MIKKKKNPDKACQWRNENVVGCVKVEALGPALLAGVVVLVIEAHY